MRPAVLLVLVSLLTAGCVIGGPSDGDVQAPTGGNQSSGPDEVPVAQLAFNGTRALDLVREQVLRPDGSVRHRIPGTEGNNETARWIADAAEARGFTASWHHFNATYGCETVPMHNIVAERPGTTGRIIMLAAHYDTRPIADRDPDLERRNEPIPGANDGGSGVAVLLELARVMPAMNDTVRLVFFDGEDGGGYKGRECTDWILGSRAYAASLAAEELASVRAFVLVDMVGDTNLIIPREANSDEALLNEVFAVAQSIGAEAFVNEPGIAVTDDHVPFLDVGVPAIDLIHTIPHPMGWPFPATHHTHDDDLEHVSADSLAAVGRTLEAWLAGL